jgi:L-alanine-DL-glutamate epimerase-like enolase superfamily enzyme
MKASFKKYILNFRRPAGTSRGVYNTRPCWFLFLEENGRTGIGECAPLPGLSRETPEQVEKTLGQIGLHPDRYLQNPDLLTDLPSVRFAFESALADLRNGGNRLLFPSDFTSGKKGIPINGLVWMGEAGQMQRQIDEKLASGFRCIKLKIGPSISKPNWNCSGQSGINIAPMPSRSGLMPTGLLNRARHCKNLKDFRNSGFTPSNSPSLRAMGRDGPVVQPNTHPVALDEELIGINNPSEKEKILDTIRPQFIILKPSLHGGISGCDEWIGMANARSIGWWITSYLESNIGLNAIAQWAFTKQVKIHQGLGTGQLFTNNFDSPLAIEGEQLWYHPEKNWNLENLLND